MLPIHGKSFHTTGIGVRLIAVRCEKCNREFFYELARIGEGRASALFGIGSQAAIDSSLQEAAQDVSSRRHHEAELVPCPSCNWINNDLVLGYRQTRYRGLARFGIILAGIGIVVSAWSAWFISIGPMKDRGDAIKALVFGSSVAIVFAIVCFLARSSLRNRIRPNRNFPLPPIVPAGTPAPLVLNSQTGRLEPTNRTALFGSATGKWVQCQIGRFEPPTLCCGCMGPVEPSAKSREFISAGAAVSIPYCAICTNRERRRKWMIGLSIWGLSLGTAATIMLVLRLDQAEYWVALVAAGLIVAALSTAIAEVLTTPARIKVIDAARGVIKLWFRNHEYTQAIGHRES